MIAIAPSHFEQFAKSRGYDTAPAALPAVGRYADSKTQELYEAWTGGQQSVARMLTDSTLNTEAMREKIRELVT